MSFRSRLRHIWRIARWEVSLGSTSLDRRTLLAGVALLLVAGGIVGAGLALGVEGLSPTQDIYRVGIDDDSPYYDVVADDAALSPREPDREKLETGELDLLVAPAGNSGTVSLTLDGNDGEGVVEAGRLGQSTVSVAHAPTEKGTAALTTFRAAVQGYNDRLMALEPNETAAYPVSVRLQYRPQSSPTGTRGGNSSDTDAGRDDDTETESGDGANDDENGGSNEGSDGDQSTDDGTSDESTDDANLDVDDERDDPDVDDEGGSFLDGLLSGGNSQGSPAEISPPFPFSSLVLAFVFLVPMNFIIQAYGGTILNERINRRGELLLVAPIRRLDIVAGKTLPYLLAAVVAITGISLGVGGGLLSVAAVLPIALAFLASTFVGAMFARSFKELTFVTVTVSVFLTTYVFVPAIFTNVTPIALISPLTLVVMELQGEAVGLGGYVFATAPFFLGSAILFLLGVGVYREEDMFTQKAVPLKFLDAIDARLRGPKSVAIASALTIPFVFIGELLAIAALYVLPIEITVPLILVVIAAIEEVAKSIHIYAGIESDRFDRSIKTALLLGGLSGLGFFVGEKFTAIAQIVGLPELVLGQATLTPAGVTPATTLALFLGPLVLHTVTAAVSALGARKEFRWYLVAMLAATLVHAAYNFAVVSAYV
ncbi:PrsW family intramembrane metalloprotease [Halohasta litorea]|uniref:PrsW family intramembrane metalloprotease n=1 Tax=Halohasta litorea TaxID=869891 RepID=A0ABD6D4S1_9EURY|nr:PrsW family intramembrane metalloprotease [Halohasta litorea]